MAAAGHLDADEASVRARRECRLKRRVLLVLAVLALPPAALGQPRSELDGWLDAQRRATELYVSGDIEGAISMLIARTPSQHRQIVDALKGAKRPPAWDDRALAAFGALHMEGALDAYAHRSTRATSGITDHIDIAETLFALVEPEAKERGYARRWELTIGLIMLAGGEYRWAETVLDRACRSFKDDVPLLVACGSLHEAMAAVPADQQSRQEFSDPALRSRTDLPSAPRDIAVLLREWGRRQMARSQTPLPLTVAQEVRDGELQAAWRALERALQLDPGNIEARIRLANIRRLKGHDAEALGLLDDVVGGRLQADARAAYLARMLAGTIELRAGQVDAAASLFADASARVPCPQSALLALAYVARARKDTAQEASALGRLVQDPQDREDPWWNYPFGQYWLPDPLLASLRAEIRR